MRRPIFAAAAIAVAAIAGVSPTSASAQPKKIVSIDSAISDCNKVQGLGADNQCLLNIAKRQDAVKTCLKEVIKGRKRIEDCPTI